MWMRGGSSKAIYLLKSDLPDDLLTRDQLLLNIMGSPDARQIDGIGGGDPLTSKVAIVSASTNPNADIDYLFLQIFVDRAEVSASQGCGNILAGVGPFAIERGLVAPHEEFTPVRIHMVNSGDIAEAHVSTPQQRVTYYGNTAIDGVPGTAAAIQLFFDDIAGSICGALLPTGNARDMIDGVACTLIDNGMPCVLLRAADFGLTGRESRDELESHETLKKALESLRLQAGRMMGLNDVTSKPVPKMTLLSPPQAGGVIKTQSFIPRRAHASIGVFAAVSVATACRIAGSVAAPLARIPQHNTYQIEHPSGAIAVLIDADAAGDIRRTGVVRTARKLMDGVVFA
jgi:4-oxalomesaconate tautomerase